MHNEINLLFVKICTQIETDEICQRYRKPGYCRLWTKAVLDLLELSGNTEELEILSEAREVNLSPFHSHTFVCLTFRTKLSQVKYVIDGIGVLNHKPYFGKLAEAPIHLKNSQPDQINTYRKLQKKQ